MESLASITKKPDGVVLDVTRLSRCGYVRKIPRGNDEPEVEIIQGRFSIYQHHSDFLLWQYNLQSLKGLRRLRDL